MSEPVVDFPIYDADNHMYETPEAFTKHLPPAYAGLIKYVQVKGRTKIAVKNVISDYIPNPTFEVVARPGAQEDYFRDGNPEGKSRREIMGEPMRTLDAFFAPEPRLALMDELGIERAVMWPTLASLLEERLSDDPWAMHVVVHALNEWMYEHWTFNYGDRIYPTPVVTLPFVDEAIKELEWVVSRGAKIVLIRPAPVPGVEGTRSFAAARVRPLLAEGGGGRHRRRHALVGRRHDEVHEPLGRHRQRRVPAVPRAEHAFEETFRYLHRGIFDAMHSAVSHGLFTRFPTLRVLPVEQGSTWVRPLVDALGHTYATHAYLFDEDPVEVFKRNVWVHPFHEDDPRELARAIGVDRVIFGSDYPHPEGLAYPPSYVKELHGFTHDEVARIMGGNLADALKIAA